MATLGPTMDGTEHKYWMSAETVYKRQERKGKKAILPYLTTVEQEVRRRIKRDKRSFVDNLAKHIEEAAAQSLYKISKQHAISSREQTNQGQAWKDLDNN